MARLSPELAGLLQDLEDYMIRKPADSTASQFLARIGDALEAGGYGEITSATLMRATAEAGMMSTADYIRVVGTDDRDITWSR